MIAAFESLSDVVSGLRSAAEGVLQDRAAAWHPLARDLAVWSELARKGNAASVRGNDLRKAIDWLRATGKEVRNARLAPFARTSAEVRQLQLPATSRAVHPPRPGFRPDTARSFGTTQGVRPGR